MARRGAGAGRILALEGVPPAPGAFTLEVEVEDAVGARADATLALEVADAPAIALEAPPPPEMRVGIPTTWRLVAVGGLAGEIEWQATGLPPGLDLAPEGDERRAAVVSGTPEVDGRFEVEVVASSTWGQASTRRAIEVRPMAVVTATLPPGRVGVGYAAQLEAIGGDAPRRWSAAGGLPPGLLLGPTGRLAGTPARGGTFAMAFAVTDARGRVAQRMLSLDIQGAAIPLAIRVDGPTDLVTCAPGGVRLAAEGGAFAGYRWRLGPSTLPPGYALTQTGTTAWLEGHATQAGSFSATVHLTDAAGGAATATVAFALSGPGHQWLAYDYVPAGQAHAQYGLLDVCPLAVGPPSTITLESPPHDMDGNSRAVRFSEDGDRLLVAPLGVLPPTFEARLIDVSGPAVGPGRRVTHTASGAAYLLQVEIDATGSRIVYSGVDAAGYAVWYRDLSGPRGPPVVLDPGPALGAGFGLLSPDGTRLALHTHAPQWHGNLHLAELSAATPVVEEVWPTSRNSVWSGWTPDARRLIFQVSFASADRRLYEIDLTTPSPRAPRRLSTGLTPADDWAASADSRWVAFIAPNAGVYVVRLGATPAPIEVHPGMTYVSDFVWSPQGDRIVYQGIASGAARRGFFVVDVGSGGPGAPTPLAGPARAFAPRRPILWSADGAWVAATVSTHGSTDLELWLWSVAGPPRAYRYVLGPAPLHPVRFSDDGRSLWLAGHGGRGPVAVVDLAGPAPGPVRRVAFPAGFSPTFRDGPPAVARDGRRAFVVVDDGAQARIARVLLGPDGRPRPATLIGPAAAWLELRVALQPR